MKAKQVFLGTVSSIALLGVGIAQAADMAPKAPLAPYPAALFDWTGTYWGLSAGVARHDWKWTPTGDWLSTAFSGDWDSSATGGIFGLQVGHNWQSGSLVYGVEADISGFAGVKASQSWPCVGGWSDHSARTKVDWLATFRGRAGLAVDRTMVYLTGGLATAKVLNGWTGTKSGPPPRNVKSDKWRLGWVAGAGIEHAFANAPRWSFKGEFLYVDLGTSSASDNRAESYGSKFSNSMMIGRVGLNYRW